MAMCGALLAMACAPIPPPSVLGQIDQVRAAPASVEAQRYAPSAFAHAEKLKQDAHDALDKDDAAACQIIGERALAAYARATTLARVARSEEVRVATTEDIAVAERKLAEYDAEQQRVAADIEALKKRLLVLKNTEPVEPSGAARGQREKARQQATATLQLQARLLCVAARLLHKATAKAAVPAELEQAAKALTELEQTLSADPAAAPIDQATRARAGCLRALTLIRRAGTPRTKALGVADALLAELSKAGHGMLRRDDRGVVITLRDVFKKKGSELTTGASKRLAALATVAQAHPRFPLLIVLHQHRAIPAVERALWEQRGDRITKALQQGATVTGVEIAGTVAPVVDPGSKHNARNERVDIVFVAPEAL